MSGAFRRPPPFTHLAVTKTERRMDSRAFGNIRRQLSLWSRRWVGTRVPLGPNGGVLLGVPPGVSSRHFLGFHSSTAFWIQLISLFIGWIQQWT